MMRVVRRERRVPVLNRGLALRRVVPSFAAALVAVTLVTPACSRSGGEREATVADADGFVRLHLPDPAASGHTVSAAVDQSAVATPASHVRHGAATQARADADDPWSEDVHVFWVDDPNWPLVGELIDLGGVLGAIDPHMESTHLDFRLGGRGVTLSSQDVPMVELQARARAAVAEGWTPGEPLPGHEVLVDHAAAARLGLPWNVGSDPVAAVAYSAHGAPDFAVSTTRGDEHTFRPHTVGDGVEEVSVRGHAAFIVREGPWTVVRWRENETTIASAATFEDVDAMLALLEELVPTSETEYARLVDRHPLADHGALLLAPSSDEDALWDDPFAVATGVLVDIEIQIAGTPARVRVIASDGSRHLAVRRTSADSDLPDDRMMRLGAPGLHSLWDGSGPMVFIGVFDTEPMAADFVDGDAAPVAVELQVVAVDLDGESAWLVVGTAIAQPAGDRPRQQIVSIRHADGSEVRYGI